MHLGLPHLPSVERCYSSEVRCAVDDLVRSYLACEADSESRIKRRIMWMLRMCRLCRATLARSVVANAVDLACLRAQIQTNNWLGSAFKDRWP